MEASHSADDLIKFMSEVSKDVIKTIEKAKTSTKNNHSKVDGRRGRRLHRKKMRIYCTRLPASVEDQALHARNKCSPISSVSVCLVENREMGIQNRQKSDFTSPKSSYKMEHYRTIQPPYSIPSTGNPHYGHSVPVYGDYNAHHVQWKNYRQYGDYNVNPTQWNSHEHYQTHNFNTRYPSTGRNMLQTTNVDDDFIEVFDFFTKDVPKSFQQCHSNGYSHSKTFFNIRNNACHLHNNLCCYRDEPKQ